MNEVATDGRGIEGIVLTRRVVGLEIEHEIKIDHLGNLCVTSDDASHLIGKDGIAVVALPLFKSFDKAMPMRSAFSLVLGLMPPAL